MSKTQHDVAEINKIISKQKYPLDAIKHLKQIAGDVNVDGLTGILAKAYCLGVIQGKREDRMRRRR